MAAGSSDKMWCCSHKRCSPPSAWPPTECKDGLRLRQCTSKPGAASSSPYPRLHSEVVCGPGCRWGCVWGAAQPTECCCWSHRVWGPRGVADPRRHCYGLGCRAGCRALSALSPCRCCSQGCWGLHLAGSRLQRRSGPVAARRVGQTGQHPALTTWDWSTCRADAQHTAMPSSCSQ